MEYKLLEENDLTLMENVLNDGNMIFNTDYIKNFISNENSYGFVAKEKDKITGFAYGYTLLRPDGKTMFYLHSIGMMPRYQDKGYDTGFIAFINEYSKRIGCSKMLIITQTSYIDFSCAPDV